MGVAIGRFGDALGILRNNWQRATSSERAYYVQLGLIGITQLTDLTLTHIGITEMGTRVGEGSPVVGFLLRDQGTLGLTLAKVAAVGLFVRYAELIRQRKNPDVACRFITPINTFYSGISMLNVWTLSQGLSL